MTQTIQGGGRRGGKGGGAGGAERQEGGKWGGKVIGVARSARLRLSRRGGVLSCAFQAFACDARLLRALEIAFGCRDPRCSSANVLAMAFSVPRAPAVSSPDRCACLSERQSKGHPGERLKPAGAIAHQPREATGARRPAERRAAGLRRHWDAHASAAAEPPANAAATAPVSLGGLRDFRGLAERRFSFASAPVNGHQLCIGRPPASWLTAHAHGRFYSP